jgi:hypothetical protein
MAEAVRAALVRDHPLIDSTMVYDMAASGPPPMYACHRIASMNLSIETKSLQDRTDISAVPK